MKEEPTPQRCAARRPGCKQSGAGTRIAPPLVSLEAPGHFLKVEDATGFFSGGGGARSGGNAFQIRRSAAHHGKGATLRGGRDRLDPRPLGPGAGHSQQRRPPGQFALTPFASSTWLKPCTFSLGSMRFAVFKRREHDLAFLRFFFLTACAPTPCGGAASHPPHTLKMSSDKAETQKF